MLPSPLNYPFNPTILLLVLCLVISKILPHTLTSSKVFLPLRNVAYPETPSINSRNQPNSVILRNSRHPLDEGVNKVFHLESIENVVEVPGCRLRFRGTEIENGSLGYIVSPMISYRSTFSQKSCG